MNRALPGSPVTNGPRYTPQSTFASAVSATAVSSASTAGTRECATSDHRHSVAEQFLRSGWDEDVHRAEPHQRGIVEAAGESRRTGRAALSLPEMLHDQPHGQGESRRDNGVA